MLISASEAKEGGAAPDAQVLGRTSPRRLLRSSPNPSAAMDAQRNIRCIALEAEEEAAERCTPPHRMSWPPKSSSESWFASESPLMLLFLLWRNGSCVGSCGVFARKDRRGSAGSGTDRMRSSGSGTERSCFRIRGSLK